MASRAMAKRGGSIFTLQTFILIILLLCANALSIPLNRNDESLASGAQQKPLDETDDLQHADPNPHDRASIFRGRLPGKPTLPSLLDALHVMQSHYFQIWQGTWPSCNDWTAEVMSTQISGTLSALTAVLSQHELRSPSSHNSAAVVVDENDERPSTDLELIDGFAFENTVNTYFDQLTTFYFGENALGLRMQAYDDMLWTVLSWLENVKFQRVHGALKFPALLARSAVFRGMWHGAQMQEAAGHRARVFYEITEAGWDEELCGGGMVWSPHLMPYKNAITNELFVAASVGMYLYYPGDDIDFPILQGAEEPPELLAKPRPRPAPETAGSRNPHDEAYLNAAIAAHAWLRDSGMRLPNGLYADGFHIHGYKDRDHPGTRQCDVLNRAVYTYNQGVLLSGLRGLWLATGNKSYLDEGHELVQSAMASTGWPDTESQEWAGLGRGGVMEESCDAAGSCSQDAQTFKGIFWHHFTEFCRPMYVTEEEMVVARVRGAGAGKGAGRMLEGVREGFMRHQRRCSGYKGWVKWNAEAAGVTRDGEGRFGMWWGRRYPDGGMSSSSSASQVAMKARDLDDVEDESVPLSSRHKRKGRSRDGKKQPPSPGKGKGKRKGKHTVIPPPPPPPPPPPLNAAPQLPPLQPLQPPEQEPKHPENSPQPTYNDVNDRGRGRTVETQAGGLAVLRALYVWENSPTLAQLEAAGLWNM